MLTTSDNMEKNNKKVPEVKRGIGFRRWYFQMTGHLNGIAESPLGAPWHPIPDVYEDNILLSAARNREARTERATEIKDWHRIERKCHQALMSAVHNDAVVSAFLQRTITTMNLALGQIPRTRVLFEGLNQEYGAASDYGLEHWTELLNGLKLRRGQPISEFIGLLDDTIGEVLSQGGVYTAAQSKTKLGSSLKNGEPECNLLVHAVVQMHKIVKHLDFMISHLRARSG